MSAGVTGINPIAKIAAALVLDIALVLTLDWVSATVALLLEGVLFSFAGVSWRAFWLRTAPVWIAAPLVAVTIALYGKGGGHSYLDWWLVHITAGSLTLAIASGLRILAVALPAVVLFMTIDATALSDGLAQLLHLPARFVVGSLAGFRLVGLLSEDWRSLERARRARGVSDTRKVRRFLGQAFALLVLSIRRATKLATAMEARGFGSQTPRTWARQSRFGWREWSLIAVGALVAAAAVTASVSSSHWNFIGT